MRTLHSNPSLGGNHQGLQPAPASADIRAGYNVAPTAMVDVIVDHGQGGEFVSMALGPRAGHIEA